MYLCSMNNTAELKQLLIDGAQGKGICSQGYERMRCSNVDALIDYYLANPDWCLERDFPDLQTLSERFADIEDRGVYVGKEFHGEVLNDLQVYIFHNCRGTINVGLNVDKAIIPMLYLANDCRMRIVGIGDIKPQTPSEVPVYTFGENDVAAQDNEFVRFMHYKSKLI